MKAKKRENLHTSRYQFNQSFKDIDSILTKFFFVVASASLQYFGILLEQSDSSRQKILYCKKFENFHLFKIWNYRSWCYINLLIKFEVKILWKSIMSRRKQLRPFKVHDDENDTDQTSEITSLETQSTNGNNNHAEILLGKHSFLIFCLT